MKKEEIESRIIQRRGDEEMGRLTFFESRLLGRLDVIALELNKIAKFLNSGSDV